MGSFRTLLLSVALLCHAFILRKTGAWVSTVSTTCVSTSRMINLPRKTTAKKHSNAPLFSVVDRVVNSPQTFFCKENDENSNDNNDNAANEKVPHLIFPGGGLFFYWQAGAVTYLREQGYDLMQVTTSGASAGALTATLLATNVDFVQATELALQLSKENGVWDRSAGLQGIWGPIIYDWLDQLLPDNAVEMVNDGKLSLLVTPIPSFGKDRVDRFWSREDLIRCNMASVHLPWFLDGKLTAEFRDRPYIDGSFLAGAENYLPERIPSSVIRLDWSKDPALEDCDILDFVKVISPEGIWGILEKGKEYARMMDEQGRFDSVLKKSQV